MTEVGDVSVYWPILEARVQWPVDVHDARRASDQLQLLKSRQLGKFLSDADQRVQRGRAVHVLMEHYLRYAELHGIGPESFQKWRANVNALASTEGYRGKVLEDITGTFESRAQTYLTQA